MSLNFFIGLLYISLNISFVLVYRSILPVKYIYLSFVHHSYIQELVCKFFNSVKIFCPKNIFVIIIIFTKWKFANFVKKSVLVNVVYLSTCTTALNVSKNLQILAKSTTIILLYTHKIMILHILIKIYQRNNLQFMKIKN